MKYFVRSTFPPLYLIFLTLCGHSISTNPALSIPSYYLIIPLRCIDWDEVVEQNYRLAEKKDWVDSRCCTGSGVGCIELSSSVTYHGCLNRWAKRRKRRGAAGLGKISSEKSSRLWQDERPSFSSSSPPVAALKMSVSDFSPVPAGRSILLHLSRNSRGKNRWYLEPFLHPYSPLNQSQPTRLPTYNYWESIGEFGIGN